MRLGRPLPRSFFDRDVTAVARDLLGRILVRRLADGRRLAVRLVEVEAYAPDDPASHSYRGPTERNRTMFGPPGRLYVYFTYGMHHCLNVVTGPEGVGAAVLLRAGEPIEGLEAMAERRGTDDPRLLCSGPGRLAQALGLTREHDGADLVLGPEIRLHEGEPVPEARVAVTTRVGINHGTERPWRFFVAGDPFVSPGRPTGSRRS
ncbi:Putative 3-methyladenine DNA glycosylase [bacterium HR12]|nr:Putative 3-methyladenine DNA glycosylase [bacterium HR12]